MLTYRPAIQTPDNTWHGLPPFELIMRASPWEVIQLNEIPFGTLVEEYSRRHGTRIDVSGFYFFNTPAEGWLWKTELEGWLRASRDARTIQLCEWVDTEDMVNGIWQNCRIVSGLIVENDEATRRGRYSFSLYTTAFEQALGSGSDGTKPGPLAWEEYLYNGESAGSGSGGEGPGVIVVPGTSPSYMPLEFTGVCNDVTNANNLGSRRFKIIFPDATNIKSLQIIGANKSSATGSTTVVASTLDYTSPPPAGSYLQNTVAMGATESASPTTGTVAIGAGAALYVYLTAAGSHSGVKVAVGIRPA